MTTSSKDTGPLDWRIAITDKAGRPTPEFQRRWAIQRANNNLIGSVTLGSGVPSNVPPPADGAEYIDISTTPFTLYVGSGGIWNQVGFDLDKIGDVEGDTLYRGVSEWEALAAGVAGQVLTTQGPSSGPIWQGIAGFTFCCTGPVPTNVLLGVASWTKDVTFTSGDPNNGGVALNAPVAAYAFSMVDAITSAQVGTIDVTTDGTFSITWIGSPLVWPANKIMLLFSQVAPDSGILGVNARIVGNF